MHLKYFIILNTTIARQTIFNVIIYLFKIFSMHNLSSRLGIPAQQLTKFSFHLLLFLKLQVKLYPINNIEKPSFVTRLKTAWNVLIGKNPN